jgi:hypothetical protein
VTNIGDANRTRGSAAHAPSFPFPPDLGGGGFQVLSFDPPPDEPPPERVDGSLRPARPRPAPRQRSGRPAARRATARAGERGGDSGDADPEPPPARRFLARRAELDAWAAERAATLLRLAAVEPQQLRLGERRRP